MECPYCKAEMRRGTASFNCDLRGYHVSWDAIPACMCDQCGESLFETQEVDRIQAALAARSQHRTMTGSVPQPLNNPFSLKMPTSRSYHDYLIQSLRNPQEAVAYLDAVLEDGTLDELRLALNNVSEAQRDRLWGIFQCDRPLRETSYTDEHIGIEGLVAGRQGAIALRAAGQGRSPGSNPLMISKRLDCLGSGCDRGTLC